MYTLSSFGSAGTAVAASPEPALTRVLVAGEQMLLLEGLATLCNTIPGCSVVAQSPSGQQALSDIQRVAPDIALLDLDLTDLLTVEVIRQVRAGESKTRCAVLSARKDRKTVLEVLRSGACGFILKSSTRQQLAEAFQHILQGGIYVSPTIEMASLVAETSPARRNSDPLDTLSSREYQVFTLLVDGVRAKEIAARLSLSPKTVDTYRSSLMRKLDIFDLAGLVKFAIQRNLVS
jgi:DNA-binding NarL/FixJ family response regulator